MKTFFIFLLRTYKAVVSPFLPAACIYHPTCSDFAVEAFQRHGSARGAYFTARRLLRCHPFHKGGFDPVP